MSVHGVGLVTHEPVIRPSPSTDDVRAELDRILQSPHLQASDRRRAFLRHIVEETLAGRADRLKGFSIAVEVFGRDETFDSQTDPVVRLEARRLRRDLDCYYVDAGSRDPVRISIPKGSYVPRFEWFEGAQPAAAAVIDDEPGPKAPSPGGPQAPRAEASPIGFRHLLAAMLAVTLAAAAAVGWFALSGRSVPNPSGDAEVHRGPAVVVLPFEALGPAEDSRYLAEGISQQLTAKLMRFPGFRLYNLPRGSTPGADATSDPPGKGLGVAYVVSGSVRSGVDDVRVAAQMADAATGQVLWTGSYDRPMAPEALIRVETELADEIATALGQPYGMVSDNLEHRLGTPAVASMKSYVCVLRSYTYRRTFSRAEFGPVLACLEDAVRRDPDYSDAWAMLGWLHLDAGRFEYGGSLQDEYAKAFEAASRAVELDPNSITALKALSSVTHYMGRYEDGERLARKAAELNPNDPDTLAQLGWRLAARGNFEEGIPILKRAIDRTVNPPGWYYQLVAIDLYLKGDYEGMLAVAERSAPDGSNVSHALIAIAAAELGNREIARAALERADAYAPLARDPGDYFRRHGVTDEIVGALVAGLAKARQLAAGS